MMLGVRAALDREREQIEILRTRLLATRDAQQALALQRQIEKVKLDTEAAILRIQAEAARKAGHTALAERLETAATELLVAPAPVTPAARPTPRGSSR
jgi:propanediol dehydratase small subunit